jgi:3-hydroxyisobutyrate dehydrogenase
MATCAFVGLGVMGSPMAGHLAGAGHAVAVFNRTGSKAAAWTARHGGRSAPSPRDAASGADVVFTCVGNDDDVRSVVYGDDGALAGMSAGAVLVDHTTASADLARELATSAAAVGVGFVDAPVSGGQAGAENGRLTVMCGGAPADFERVAPVIAAYSVACTLIGPVGHGQLTKMVNQIAIAGVVQGLAEAVSFGQRAGLDMEAVIATIGKGAAASWQLDNRAPTMLRGEFEFGFAVDWMRKDLAICLDEARRSGARLPVAALVDQFYAQVQNRGGRRWDTSSLVQLLTDD